MSHNSLSRNSLSRNSLSRNSLSRDSLSRNSDSLHPIESNTDLGECKWGSLRSAGAVEEALKKKAALYPNPRNATLGQRIFLRGARPKKTSPEVRWYSLEDLYA